MTTKIGNPQNVEVAYMIVNKATGAQYKTNRRGFAKNLYRNEALAMNALMNLPEKFRSAYEVKACNA